MTKRIKVHGAPPPAKAKPTRSIAVKGDNSDSRQAGAQHDGGEERFRSILRDVPSVAVQGYDMEGITTYWNPSSEKLYGFSAQEALGRNLLDLIIPEEMKEGVRLAIQEMAKTGRPIPAAELLLQRKDGSRVLVFSSHAVVRIPGRAAELFCLDIDLTDRRQTEEALQESEDRYRSLFESSLDPILLTAPDGRIFAANEAACQLLGRTEKEIQEIGRDGIVDLTDDRLAAAIAQRNRTGSFRGELTFLHKTGEKIPCEVSSSLFHDRHGKVRTSMIMRDLSAHKKADEALRASEARHRETIEFAVDGILRGGKDGQIIDANSQMQRLAGRSREELLGLYFTDLFSAEELKAVPPQFEQLDRGHVVVNERNLLRPDGTTVRVEMHSKKMPDGTYQSIYRDITARNLAETKLRESEERYQRITAAVTDYIYTVHVTNGRAAETRHGPGCEAVTGYRTEEFSLDPYLWLRMVLAEDRAIVELQAARILAGENPLPLEHRITHKNGSVRWVRNTFVPHRNEVGILVAYDGLIQNITAQKLAENALRKSKQQYDNLAAQIPIGIYILRSTADGMFVLDYASPKMAEIFDTTVAHLLADAAIVLRSVHPDEAAAFAELNREGIRLMRPFNWEGRALINGATKWLHLASSPEPQESGDVLWFGIVNDISARKETEEALRENEASLQESQLIAGLGSYVLDIPAGIWRSSEVLNLVLGIDHTYARTVENWVALIHPDDRGMMADYLNRQVLGQRQSFNKEYRIVRQDNRAEQWVHGIGKLEFDPQGQPLKMRGTIQDVTKRKQAEQAIAALALRNQTLLQTAGDGIHVIDEHGNVVEANAAFCHLLGYTREELLQLNVADWDAQWSRDALIPKISDLIKGAAVFETRHRRKDGSIREVEINSVGVSLEGKKYLYASARDITERKQVLADREKLAAQNQQLQKTESLGRMAGAIAHHFNNQLQSVMMRLEMALHDLPKNIEPVESLTEAMKSARKAAEVSTQMLTYLGQSFGQPEQLDLADLCRRQLPLLRIVIPRRVSLESDLPLPGPCLNANPDQIQQVLTNLITNAWEAAGEGSGTVRLSVRMVDARDIPTANRYPLDWRPRNSAYACLEVSDTGCGIATADIEKLFDPFFSSKFTGRGLGLSVVLGIARTHHGACSVVSESGKGSTFCVFLPVLVPPADSAGTPSASMQPVAASRTILVVEGQATMRATLALALKLAGYGVVSAIDGNDAVTALQECPGKIDCVLCDVSAPGGEGWAVLAALRKIRPELPAIISGPDSKSRFAAQAHPAHFQEYLQKPYDLNALKLAVATTLPGTR